MKKHFSHTPLRYPGGKQKLFPLVQGIVRANGLEGCQYAEPFAGGAGVALGLLYQGLAAEVFLNDLDNAVFAFWSCALHETEALVRRIADAPVTMSTWEACRRTYCADDQYSRLDLAFATFFLNRTNRSGIIRGGVIGGKDQTGRWKIDARFNKAELIKRIEKVGHHRARIHVSNYDAAFFLENVAAKLGGKTLVYLDPPYYFEGSRLYRNRLTAADHKLIADVAQSGVCPNWIVSYDNVPPVHEVYAGCKCVTFDLNHSAHRHHVGREVMFAAEHLEVPIPCSGGARLAKVRKTSDGNRPVIDAAPGGDRIPRGAWAPGQADRRAARH